MANRLLQLNMIPPEDDMTTAAIAAMKRMSNDAKHAGVADMTLEEIDTEIEAVRNENRT